MAKKEKAVTVLPVGGLKEAVARLDAEIASGEVEGVVLITTGPGGAQARVRTFGGIDRCTLAWAACYMMKWSTED